MDDQQRPCPKSRDNIRVEWDGPRITDHILCQFVQNGEVETFPELKKNIEEADVRLISHAIHAVLAGTERIVILSSDTDVLGIALYFWNLLNSHGLRQFWMRTGVSDSIGYIRLHSLAK